MTYPTYICVSLRKGLHLKLFCNLYYLSLSEIFKKITILISIFCSTPRISIFTSKRDNIMKGDKSINPILT